MTRTNTPDRIETTEQGHTVRHVTHKWYCDRDHLLDDATDAEIQAAIEGRPLPDVNGECTHCAPATGSSAPLSERKAAALAALASRTRPA